jgi:8-oxo-dGTP pyrophosphatase MutT (NUDIX family)
LPDGSISPLALRERFACPVAWQPEFTGDAFRLRDDAPRPAAVLVPVVQHGSHPTVLLTERTAHLSSHAGQIAFPGGRSDPTDGSPEETALREAWEEIGLARDHVEIVGRLPEYLTGTGYHVTPVVALVRPGFELAIHAFEVAEAFEVPLAFLMNPRHHFRHRVRLETGDRVFYSMPWRPDGGPREYFIWGATAAMLRNLYRFLSA